MTDEKPPKTDEGPRTRSDFFRDLKKATRKLGPDEKKKPEGRRSGRSPGTT